MIRKLLVSDLCEAPRPGGRGKAITIVASPADGTCADFDWSVSTAKIASLDQTFLHAEVDCTLAVIGGGPLLIVASSDTASGQRGHAVARTLGRHSEPYRLAGELSVYSKPFGNSPAIDFCVMTRRDRCTHRVQRLDLRDDVEVAAAQLVAYCTEGMLRYDDTNGGILHSNTLEAGEVIHATGNDAEPVRLRFSAAESSVARVYIASIDPPHSIQNERRIPSLASV